jgi:phosphopantetheinyl transferase (holo-ACP synthase)
MQFSVSGSNGAAVVAIRAQGKVGIDLELDDRKRTFDRLLQAFNQEFARGAMADGGSVPGIPSHRDLLQVWTRKEAAVKALGAGMAVPLRDVIVTPAQELPRLISLPESSLTGLGISDFKLNPLQMSDVDLPSPWIGSIAYTGQLDSIEYFNGVAALRQMSEGSS